LIKDSFPILFCSESITSETITYFLCI